MDSGGLGLTESLGRDIGQDELDFDDLFMYNTAGEDFSVHCDKGDPDVLFHNDNQPPLLLDDHHTVYTPSSCQLDPSQNPSAHSPTNSHNNLPAAATFDSLGPASRPGIIPAPSPRIEITPSGDSLSSQTLQPSPGSTVLGGYRECVSPASSNSSTGWPAESYSPVQSPCVSPSNAGSTSLSALDLCPGLQNIHTSPALSSPRTSPSNGERDETYLQPQHQRASATHLHQRSRSASPHGKRSYNQSPSCQGGTPVKQRSRSPSPIPSGLEQHATNYLHQYQAQAEFEALVQTAAMGLKEEWNTGLSRVLPSVMVQSAQGPTQRQDCVLGEVYDWAIEQERVGRAGVKSDMVYVVPSMWPPPHPVHHGTFSGLTMASLPPLERSLPSQSGQYELLIQQQPRSHHRAHYETEGSRGAVKTPKGGHPEVQLRGYQGSAPLGLQVFIGTADERLLRPHPFYQVHRITGKTVTTPNQERMIKGTKVLEIPLEPKNHMRVVIDCVGILKLRNADIELRNGETDIGRRNTRVRLVFRVHIPQPGGQLMSLQVASEPIECSQRSAQENPTVERQDLDRCSVLGGQQMVLTGQNFTPDSRVIFSEKTQDGRQIWEVEASVDKEKTQSNMLFVELPPYQDQTICHPAKVNFYVINGKKKCSQPQHFIYTPVISVKAEPQDDYLLNSYSYSTSGLPVPSVYHQLERENNFQSISPTLYHVTAVDRAACVLTPDPLDDQPSAFYQPQASAHSLITGPVLYHTGNPHYGNRGAVLLGGSPGVSHSDISPNQCVSSRPSVGDPCDGAQVGGAGWRQQTTAPHGKSPPMRYIQAQATAECRLEPGGGHHEEWVSHKVTIKQENLSYASLEDVNDIIRRDQRGHNGE